MNKLILTATALMGFYSAHAQTTLIFENFEGYTAEDSLYTGFKYDLTYNKTFTLTDTNPNILGFYAGSGTSWIVKTDPLVPSNLVLWGSGFDNQSQIGKGIYMMRLDPTAGGTFTSGSVSIDYSFRMMRDAGDPDSATAFDVRWVSRPETLDDGSENLDMYQWTGDEVTVQSFVTSGNEESWVTVSGSIIADLSTLDTTSPYATGIRVQATNGAFVSGGQGLYYLDDISVTVTAVPEPATFALLFGFTTLGLVLYRRRMKQSA